MKYLLFLYVIFVGCCVQSKKTKGTNTAQEKVVQDSVSLCEQEFKQFLRDSLKYMERPAWFPHVVLKRNDNFVKILQEKFAGCINGKKSDEIIRLFGKPSNQDAKHLTYDCIYKDEDAKTGENEKCLIFERTENMVVKNISYYACWGRQ